MWINTYHRNQTHIHLVKLRRPWSLYKNIIMVRWWSEIYCTFHAKILWESLTPNVCPSLLFYWNITDPLFCHPLWIDLTTHIQGIGRKRIRESIPFVIVGSEKNLFFAWFIRVCLSVVCQIYILVKYIYTYKLCITIYSLYFFSGNNYE